ncbi:glycoside hydrolase family 71/99 protein [Marinoscillum furvescens]|uniref:Uncharacterized protein n=1 Tax=Marinoscillum furvescens DSM 4134 TaxID=1122208 RepID=A0A3D9L548_MARFU|nr:hypothetical protein [Marinoscillum furvescens]RED98347.1 hypothetical protein C7460_11017 [Marinoscillum furvescens DSM 4134]
MNKLFIPLYSLLLLTIFYRSNAQSLESQVFKGPKFSTDDWVGTDALGRSLPTHEEVGDKRPGKLVGMFYYIWHGYHDNTVYDITKILKENPENPEYGPKGKFHFWGEPEYGYYLPDDPWVIRHDLQMFANADIDFIFFDVTNNFTYLSTVKVLCEISLEMRKQGINTPEICFLSNTKSGRVLNELYDEFYSKALFKELWFYWDGKPLILGHENDPVLRSEVKDFFTIKYSWAWTDTPKEPNHWQWLDTHPQDYGWSKSRQIPEQIVVTTANHPLQPMGKSFNNGEQPEVDKYYMTGYTDQGLYFAEQWERALEVDPQVIMITQWNEWVAQRFINDDKRKQYGGRPIKEGDTFFVDAFTQEFNRDIAPMKGGHSDNYYYQLISNIRKFKGMDKPPTYSTSSIRIDREFDDWNDVLPVYYDHVGDTLHRDFLGYDKTTQYTNKTGRNDIIECRVNMEDDQVCFYAKTNNDLSPTSDKNWMLLFIDIDQNKSTGWEGYDFVINHGEVTKNSTSLKKWSGNEWIKVKKLKLAVANNQLEFSIPWKTLGSTSFDFHWADNPGQLKDISGFFLDGDSAPDRRFNYHFQPN